MPFEMTFVLFIKIQKLVKCMKTCVQDQNVLLLLGICCLILVFILHV